MPNFVALGEFAPKYPQQPRLFPIRQSIRLFRTGDCGRQSVISDGDFGRCVVKSDGDFGRCAVYSDGDFGRCAVNSDAQLSGLLYHYFDTNVVNFGW